MVLGVLMVFCNLMGFGTLAKTEDQKWSFLLCCMVLVIALLFRAGI